MVQAKKPVRKSAPATKRATKTTVKKVTPKATTTRSTPNKKSAVSSESFFTFRITHETFYWFILGAVVIALCIWVTTLTIRVQNLYDQIEINGASQTVLPAPVKK